MLCGAPVGRSARPRSGGPRSTRPGPAPTISRGARPGPQPQRSARCAAGPQLGHGLRVEQGRATTSPVARSITTQPPPAVSGNLAGSSGSRSRIHATYPPSNPNTPTGSASAAGRTPL
ncbi:hypothetical protein ACFQ0B_74830 [Nonomuraea thailandensis]